MAVTQLNTAAGGINRQRTKGGPRPENLYDLLNGYVDGSGAVQSRPGTREVFTLPPGTKGMCAFDGELVVFSHQVIEGIPEGVKLEVLPHPNHRPDEGGEPIPLAEIHFAGPFLGYLFVTAEFDDGQVFDYWLRSADAWQPETTYKPDELVQPSVPNGFVYRPHRLGDAPTTWEPSVERAVGDVVAPTVENGFDYVAVEVHGNPPRSGTVEPDWPTEAGAVVAEESDSKPTTPPTQTPPPTSPPPRYGNPGGGTPPKDDGGSGGSGHWQVQ